MHASIMNLQFTYLDCSNTEVTQISKHGLGPWLIYVTS